MSLISLPRLYFQGSHYWNPSTFNNNDDMPTYDAPNARLNWPFLNLRGVDSPGEFRRWAIRPTYAPDSQAILPPAEWNYYGGMQCGFVSETVPRIENRNFSRPPGAERTVTTGFTGSCGRYHGPGGSDQDAWLGLQVQLNAGDVAAKMCDVNPQAFWSTQIFADSLTVGSASAGQGFTAPIDYRMHSRWVYLQRNYNTTGKLIIAGGLSCLYQTCIPTGAITYFGHDPKPESFQAQLRESLTAAGVAGLMIRYTVYDTVYFQGTAFDGLPDGEGATNARMIRTAELYEEYEAALEAFDRGESLEKPAPPINRAYSKAVGWIGLWKEGELVSVPEGRILNPGDVIVEAKGLPDAFYENGSSQVSIGPAEVGVEIDDTKCEVTRLAVDLGTSMPEQDISGEKADFGTLRLSILTGDDDPLGTPIATLPNDRASYDRTAGVVDVPASEFECELSPEQVRNHRFALVVETYDAAGGTQSAILGLTETPLTAQTDQRGVYVEEPDPPFPSDPPSSSFTVKVQHFGRPPEPGTRLALAQYGSAVPWMLVRPEARYVDLVHGGDVVTDKTLLELDPRGEVTVVMRGVRPGFPNIVFHPVAPEEDYSGPAPVLPPPATTSAFFTVGRVLPFDNLMALQFRLWLEDTKPDVNYVNHAVFDGVYGTFHLLYPVMSFIDTPLKFQAWRGQILEVTDRELFGSARYMPASRALSAGQRQMIECYVDYLAGQQVGSEKAAKRKGPAGRETR